MSLLQAIGQAIGVRAVKEVVTPRLISSTMAAEWNRLANEAEATDPARASLLRQMVASAQVQHCPQRQIGLADDYQFQTLLVVRCDECGLEAVVRPGQRKFCFARAPTPSPETNPPHPDQTPTVGE